MPRLGGSAVTPPEPERVVRFEWPGLPDMALSSNGRRALGRYAASRVAEARRTAMLQYRVAGVDKVMIPKGARITLAWTVVEHDYAGCDPDALADIFKPWIDALCKPRGVRKAQPGIGLIFTDGPKYIARVSYGVEVDRERAPLTILELEVLGG